MLTAVFPRNDRPRRRNFDHEEHSGCIRPSQSLGITRQQNHSGEPQNSVSAGPILLKADVIVLQFPFNWYSVPGLLKTWIDEVLLHGFAYGSGAKLSGKTVLLSITAGAPEAAYQRDGFTGHTVFELLTPLAVTAKACSMIFAEPVVSYGYSVPAAQNDKENYLANARKHAQALSAQLKAL